MDITQVGSFVLGEPRGKYKTAGFFYPAAKIIGTSVLAIFSSLGLASKKIHLHNKCKIDDFEWMQIFFVKARKFNLGFK